MGASSLSALDREALAKYLGPLETSEVSPILRVARCRRPQRPTPGRVGTDGGRRLEYALSIRPLRWADARLHTPPWAFGFPAFSQPTIAGGRLYLGSADGPVYSLDVKSGCIHWA
jgi:hypothetical protein